MSCTDNPSGFRADELMEVGFPVFDSMGEHLTAIHHFPNRIVSDMKYKRCFIPSSLDFVKEGAGPEAIIRHRRECLPKPSYRVASTA